MQLEIKFTNPRAETLGAFRINGMKELLRGGKFDPANGDVEQIRNECKKNKCAVVVIAKEKCI